MKNVKVILISVALCATVFANARIEALGGDAGFWPGDRANVELYPGALNDGNWVEFGGVQGTPSGSINWGDDVKWGFNFDAAGNNDWMNMSWAKDGMGLSVAMLSSSTAGVDVSGFDVAWGQTMSFGELGVSYSTTDDGVAADPITDLTVNWRNACDAWIFDNAKAALSMTDDGAGTTATVLTYDLFTHIKPADGVTALLGMGFAADYLSHASADHPPTRRDNSARWLAGMTSLSVFVLVSFAAFPPARNMGQLLTVSILLSVILATSLAFINSPQVSKGPTSRPPILEEE